MNAQIAPARKRMPISTRAHRHGDQTDAIKNSLTIAPRKTTPMRIPMANTEVVVNRNTTIEMISHAIPVRRKTHHGPTSRPRPARSTSVCADSACGDVVRGDSVCGLLIDSSQASQVGSRTPAVGVDR